jgi:hypothetical protein
MKSLATEVSAADTGPRRLPAIFWCEAHERSSPPNHTSASVALSTAILSHFADETCFRAILDRAGNKHRDDATAANPFAFTKLHNVNLRNLILRAIASNYGNRPPEASFMPILLACLELRADLPLAV